MAPIEYAMKVAVALLAMLATTAVSPKDATRGLRTQPRTLDDMPCPPMPVVSSARMALIVEPKRHIAKTPPASEADRTKYMNWSRIDPDGLCRYREEDRTLPPATSHRVIFLGDSITEAWKPSDPSLFTDDVLDRGVSGETTTQMLARFRTDVIDLHPAVVHIMGGINDIASPSGTSLTRSNIESMVDLARSHGITVILGSVTPSSFFQGSPDKVPGPHIVWLNLWLRNYARRNGLIYVDYCTPLEDSKLGIKDGLSNDGLHPNRLGFEVMTPLARAAIRRALARRPALSPYRR